MLDMTRGILVSKILLLLTFILQVIEILVQLNVLPPRGNLMKIVYAGIAACWLLAGRSVFHAILPTHNLSGKTISQTEGTGGYDNHNLPVSYIVRQAPAERLRDFLISIGKHNYAIMEQAGQTYLVFYNGNEKNGNSTGLKDMLLKLFPGLVLEQTGFDQLLGLPQVDHPQVEYGSEKGSEMIVQQENIGTGESSFDMDRYISEISLLVKDGKKILDNRGILALPFLVVMIHVIAFNTGLPVMIPLISSFLLILAAVPSRKSEISPEECSTSQSDSGDDGMSDIANQVEDGGLQHSILDESLLTLLNSMDGLEEVVITEEIRPEEVNAEDDSPEVDGGTSLLEGSINQLLEADVNDNKTIELFENQDVEKLESNLKNVEKVLAETPIKSFSKDRLQEIMKSQLNRSTEIVNSEKSVNNDILDDVSYAEELERVYREKP